MLRSRSFSKTNLTKAHWARQASTCEPSCRTASPTLKLHCWEPEVGPADPGRKGKSRDDLAIPKSKLRLPKEDTYKFKSDDPNLLSGILDDLRGELEDCDQFGPTSHSKFKPAVGGDANMTTLTTS
jgi:hypothetical protein